MTTPGPDAPVARSPDRRLPHLETAWSGQRMLALLNGEVLPLLLPGRELLAVERTRTRYQPGNRCVLLYDLVWRKRAEGLPASATATFVAADLAHELPADGPSCRRLPAWGCAVELFPADVGLPAMAAALDTTVMAQRLAMPQGALRVEILRYLPHERCVLRYGAGAGSDVVGKIYPTPESAHLAARLLGALRPQAAERGLLMPELLGEVPGWNLVLMEHLQSKPWEKALSRKTDGAAAQAAVCRAAGALATFHGLQHASDARERSLATEAETALGRIASLGTIVPEFAERADAVIGAVLARAGPCSPGPRCLGHGDFAPSQLLVVGDRLAIIDVDMVCPADPALDVANFMAKLHRKAVSKDLGHHRALAAHFLAEYCRLAPEHHVGERVALFRAIRLVRMAVDGFLRSPVDHARDGTSALSARLVAEAAQTLSADVSR